MRSGSQDLMRARQGRAGDEAKSQGEDVLCMSAVTKHTLAVSSTLTVVSLRCSTPREPTIKSAKFSKLHIFNHCSTLQTYGQQNH